MKSYIFIIYLLMTMITPFSFSLSADETKKREWDSGSSLLREILKNTPLDAIETEKERDEDKRDGKESKVRWLDISGNEEQYAMLKRSGLLEGGSRKNGLAPGQGIGNRTSVYAGFGIFMPKSDYGSRYRNSQAHSLCADFNGYSLMGLVPGAAARYSPLISRERPEKVSSTFSFFQVSIGLMYPLKTGLSIYKSPVIIYGRVTDGISRISFEYELKNGQIVEYVHTFEAFAGVMCSVNNVFMAGIDYGYRLISTKDVPFQAHVFSVYAGVRI